MENMFWSMVEVLAMMEVLVHLFYSFLSWLKAGFLSDLLTNEKPDERQIMTYVSCYYHAFQGAMQVCSGGFPFGLSKH